MQQRLEMVRQQLELGGVQVDLGLDPIIVKNLSTEQRATLAAYQGTGGPDFQVDVLAGPVAGSQLDARYEGGVFSLDTPTASVTMAGRQVHATAPAHHAEPGLRTVLRVFLMRALVARGGLLLHASSFVDAGRAWLLPGPSGLGKSTTLRSLCAKQRLSDDTVAVVRHAGGWRAVRLPFRSKHGFDGPPVSAPVAGFLHLRHADELAILPVTRRRAAALVARGTYGYGNHDIQDALLDVVVECATSVKHFQLELPLGASFLENLRVREVS